MDFLEFLVSLIFFSLFYWVLSSSYDYQKREENKKVYNQCMIMINNAKKCNEAIYGIKNK